MITLNESEQKLSRFLAKMRHDQARAKGRTDKQIGPQSSEETDLEGIGAEIAFCKLFNIYPDTEIGHTPDADCILRTGERVDVKATRHTNGHLLAVPWKTDAVDLFALIIGTFPTYRLAGFMTSAELLQPTRLKDFGHGKGYAARQDELLQLPTHLRGFLNPPHI